MAILSKHPRKSEIDTLIKSNMYSYRQLQTEFLTRFGLKISHKAIQNYHTNTLGGEVEINAGDGENGDGENVQNIPLDVEKMDNLIKSLKKKGINAGDVIRGEISPLFALQVQLTNFALLQHINGVARYPSEYIKNLKAISELILATQKSTGVAGAGDGNGDGENGGFDTGSFISKLGLDGLSSEELTTIINLLDKAKENTQPAFRILDGDGNEQKHKVCNEQRLFDGDGNEILIVKNGNKEPILIQIVKPPSQP